MEQVVANARPAVAGAALRGERTAGALLLRAGPAAGFAVAGIALAAAVLVPAQLWRPVVVWPVVAVVVARAGRLAAALPARPVPVWSAAGCAVVAVGHGVWAAATHAEHVVLRRDAGSYALFAQWLGSRHGLPVGARLDAFGGPGVFGIDGFTLASPAYYQVLEGPAGAPTGAHVVPQFLLGAPALWSLGWWVHGWPGLLAVPALVSALAVLAVAGLAARVVGPRWAPLAAVALALTYPVLHVARSTYSEAPALLLVATAAALAADATVAGRRVGPVDPVGPVGPVGAVSPVGPVGPAGQAGRVAQARRLALGAGVVLGLAGLVRVDALREVALVLPGAALLALRRHPAAGPLAVGAVGGIGLAAAVAAGTSRPYLGSIAGSLLPLVAAFVVLGAGSAAAVLVGRRRAARASPRPPGEGSGGQPGEARSEQRAGITSGLARRLAVALGVGVAAVGAVLASRPLWLVVRQSPDDPGSRYVRALQLAQGLRLDGGRTYAEQSLRWVAWWTGPVAVLAAWTAFAVLAWQAARWWQGWSAPVAGSGRAAGSDGALVRTPVWLLPALVGFGSVLLTLYRPGITPDHPWADRRLVPVVLPAVVLGATAAAAVAFRRARRRMPATVLAGVAAVGVAALLVPPAVAARPLAGVRTERGELAAVAAVCAALRPGDVVLAVDARADNEWPQLIRGVCGRPAAALRLPRTATDPARAAAVAAVRQRVAGSTVDGRPGRLMLLAAGGDVVPQQALAAAGAAGARRVVDLRTVEDARLLVRRPERTLPLTVEVWLVASPG